MSLTPNKSGGIDIFAAGSPIGTIAPPIAYDSSPDHAGSVGTFTLTDTGAGTYSLRVAMDPAFMASAVYPVVLDPTVDAATERDGYVDSTAPNTSFEQTGWLKTDSTARTSRPPGRYLVEGQ